MSKKWKNYKSDKPVEAPKEKSLISTQIIREEMEKPKKESFYNELKSNGAIHFFAVVGIFAILALSVSIYQISYNEKEDVIIKLDYVDNYTNMVRDECGTMYTPVKPRLSTSVRVEEKEKDKSAPAILLNESDIYEAVVMSSPAIDGGMFFKEITGFKLADPSKYVKNC